VKLENLFPFLRRRRRLLDRVGEFRTVVGSGMEFEGALQGAENCLVEGRVRGNTDVTGTLMVGEQGRIEGNATATNLIIAGEVAGDLVAQEQLVVTATARIRGHLVAPTIAIAKGAAFDGEVRMKRAKVTRYEERREITAPLDRG
jgi:cytoskeletal protein CcmA (bactofilin family)